MALQPPLQEPEAPGTFTLSIAICQYPRRVTGALYTHQHKGSEAFSWSHEVHVLQAFSKQEVSPHTKAGNNSH